MKEFNKIEDGNEKRLKLDKLFLDINDYLII